MITLYARRHQFHRGEKYADMIDVYSKDAKGKPCPQAMVHVDCFDGLQLHQTLSRTDKEIELRILDTDESVGTDTVEQDQ
jgi:hypothetical protein